MSDRQAGNPYSEAISAMEPDTISRAAAAVPETMTIKSPSAVDDQVRRKAIGSQNSRPTIRTGPSRLQGDLKPSTSANLQHAAYDKTTTPPHVDTRITGPHLRPQSNSSPSAYQTERATILNNLKDQPPPQHIFTDYGRGEDIGESDTHGLYMSSSTTINSMRPLAASPFAPSPLSIVKTVTQQQQKSMSTIREIALVGTVCLAHFFTQAGLSQSIAPLPLIASSFTTPTHEPSPSWYSAAYSLTVGTFILPSGRLGDIYGPKRLFIIGWLWFSLSSLAAGLYPRIRATGDQQGNGDGGEIFFCFCRALQGIGPALLMPNGLAILGRTYEEGNRKNMTFALFGASAPVGFVVGSVMSSLLAQKTNWCWAYWGLAIACTVMAIISVPVIPSIPGTNASATIQDNAYTSGNGTTKKKIPLWKQLDYPGTILGVTSLILINFAINQAALVSWSTPYTYFLLILGVLILSLFFFVEFHPSLTSHPLIPPSILSLDTCFVLACIACGWATFSIWIFYLWGFLERLRNLSPLVAAAQFSPAAISGLLAAVSTGFLLSKTTPQVIMLLSMCAFFIGTTLLATAPISQVYWAQAFVSIIIMPWGMDMSFPSATILLSSKVGKENQGVAMSLVNTVVNYSISVGLGLAGTVERSVHSKHGDGREVLRGFRGAWYFGMGLSGVGVLIALSFVAVGMLKGSRSWVRRGEKEGVGNA